MKPIRHEWVRGKDWCRTCDDRQVRCAPGPVVFVEPDEEETDA